MVRFVSVAHGVLKAASRLPTFVPSPNKDLGTLIGDILRIIITLVVIAAVIYLMINGLKFITSGGDSSKAQEAQKGVTYAIIGIVVALAAAVLVNFVLARVGTPIEDLSNVQ